MTKLTNITKGPKGVHAVSGFVSIDAGKTSDDLELSEGELASAESTGYFTFDGQTEEGLNANTVAELKAIAEAEEIDLGDATKKADIIAAIELAREARAA